MGTKSKRSRKSKENLVSDDSLKDQVEESTTTVFGEDSIDLPTPEKKSRKRKKHTTTIKGNVDSLEGTKENVGTTETGQTKSYRKRKKHYYNGIRAQMEFYFGDANLSKDRFLKQLIDKDPCECSIGQIAINIW